MSQSGLIVQRVIRFWVMLAVLVSGTVLLALPVRAQEPLELTQAPNGSPPGTQHPLPTSPISLTHSVSLTIQSGNSQACGSTQSGYTAQNSFWRVYDLDGDFGIIDPFTVQGVVFGVDNTNGIFDVTVRAYTLSGPFTLENLTLISQANLQLDSASNGTLVSVTLPQATMSPQSDLVIEIDVPNGQAQPANFYPASNDLGQTDPSYLSAPSCGFPEPTDLADLGFPEMHLVMIVNGDTGLPTAVSLSDFTSRTASTLPVATFVGTVITLTGVMVYVFRRRTPR
jgi:hypothetical protein